MYLGRPLLLFCSYLINPCRRTLFCLQAPVCRSAVSYTHPHWWASQQLSVSLQQGHPSFLSQSLDSRLHICLFSIGAFKKIRMFLNIKQSGWKIPHSNPSGVLNCWSVLYNELQSCSHTFSCCQTTLTIGICYKRKHSDQLRVWWSTNRYEEYCFVYLRRSSECTGRTKPA